jgi:hypothetical protein
LASASPESSVSIWRRRAVCLELDERVLGVLDDLLVALGLAELDQLDIVADAGLEFAHGFRPAHRARRAGA